MKDTIEGGPSEADVDELFEGTPGPDDEGQSQPQTQTQKTVPGGQPPVAQPAAQPSAPAALTKEDFLAGIEKLRQQPDKPLSPEEMNKLLNVWNPDVKFIEAFFNPENTPEARMQAFIQMRDGLITQALTGMRHMLDYHQQQFEPRFTAFENFVQERRQSELRGEFLKQYPGLQKYSKLMSFISNQVEQSGYKAKDVESGFKHLADEATKFIKENIDPDFDPSVSAVDFGQQTQQQQPAEGLPSMASNGVRGAQGGARSPTRSPASTGPDGGIWDD